MFRRTQWTNRRRRRAVVSAASPQQEAPSAGATVCFDHGLRMVSRKEARGYASLLSAM